MCNCSFVCYTQYLDRFVVGSTDQSPTVCLQASGKPQVEVNIKTTSLPAKVMATAVGYKSQSRCVWCMRAMYMKMYKGKACVWCMRARVVYDVRGQGLCMVYEGKDCV